MPRVHTKYRMPPVHTKYRMSLEHTKYRLLRHTIRRSQGGGVVLDEMASVLSRSNVYFTEFKFVLTQGTQTHEYNRVNYRPGEIDVNRSRHDQCIPETMKSNSRTSYHFLFNTDAVFVIIEGKRNYIFASGVGWGGWGL